MKEIPLTRGYTALVDDEDYSVLSQFRWCVLINRYGKPYAVRMSRSTAKSYRTQIYMHREIMGVTKRGIMVDHKDMNGINNQRHNLRICTDSENKCNKKSHKGSISQYKGVSMSKGKTRWVAQIAFNKRVIKVGGFIDEISAARAYNAAATYLHGEFARLNIFE